MRSIAHQNLNQPNEAQANLQKAIDLAQASNEADSVDWAAVCNLGLYHLVMGNQVESDRSYQLFLNATEEMIEIAIRDLGDMGELRIENVELRIGETIERLKVGRTIVE